MLVGLAEPPRTTPTSTLSTGCRRELVRCVNSITVGLGGGLGVEKGKLYPKTKAAEMLERFPGPCHQQGRSR
jgi:hypothetical protein